MARSIRLLAFTIAAAASVAATQACGDDGELSSTVEEDGGKTTSTPDANSGADDGGDALTTLRLAHLAPELGAIDFCYQAARAGSFEGPVLEGKGAEPDASTTAQDAATDADAAADGGDDAAATDAGATGLAYGSVTKYFTVNASGTITIAVVRAGAKSCDAPLAQGTITLDPGKLATVALFGAPPDAGSSDAGAPTIASFVDSRETKDDRARVRFIHAANAGAIAIRVTGATTIDLAERVEPRKASVSSQTIPVDDLGFATIAPVAPPASLVIAPFAVDGGSTPEPWKSVAVDLDLRGGSLHTGFVLDDFAILWCADKSTTAELTACTLLH